MLYLAVGTLEFLPLALLAGLAADGGTISVRRASNDRSATTIDRRRAKRAQRRREQREFRAWLQITAEPLW